MTDPTQAASPADQNKPATIAGQSGASPTSPQGATAADPAQAAAPAPPAAPTARPTWIPESFWDTEKSAPKEKEFSEHLASLEKLKADTEAKRGAIPAKPEDYKPDLGEIKLPPGRELDVKDPRFVELQKVAHEEGLSSDQFNKLLRIEANAVVESARRAAAGRDEMLRMLGDNAAARVDALSAWIDAQFTEPSEARQVKDTMWTPTIVKFYEKIQKAVSGQGLHGFVQVGREGASRDDDKPDGWDKLSPVDRRAWLLQEGRRKAS